MADAGYGDNPNFLAGLEARQLAYVCGVESNFAMRLPAEVEQAAALPGPAQPARGPPRAPRPLPLHTAAELSAGLCEPAWRTVIWREGARAICASSSPPRASTGDRQARRRAWAQRPHWARGLAAGRAAAAGQEGEPKWYLSNLPVETPLRRLVELAHCRWSVEQFYEDAKGECGLDDYQGRLWDGFHRHVALVMLTYSFLAQQRLAAPAETFPPQKTAEPAGAPPPDAHRPPPGPRPLVADHRPDRELPPTAQLTRPY